MVFYFDGSRKGWTWTTTGRRSNANRLMDVSERRWMHEDARCGNGSTRERFLGSSRKTFPSYEPLFSAFRKDLSSRDGQRERARIGDVVSRSLDLLAKKATMTHLLDRRIDEHDGKDQKWTLEDLSFDVVSSLVHERIVPTTCTPSVRSKRIVPPVDVRASHP